MRAYELKKEGNGIYTATSYELVAKDRKLMRSGELVAEKVSLEDAGEFLENEGLNPDEFDVAIVEMEKNEHNMANFGIMGNFICSYYEGSVN